MCQRLISAVDIRTKLKKVAPEDVLALFEDWLEEVENQAISLFQENPKLSPEKLAHKLKISAQGATFLIDKMIKEGKLKQLT